jgi:hypothetical protein
MSNQRPNTTPSRPCPLEQASVIAAADYHRVSMGSDTATIRYSIAAGAIPSNPQPTVYLDFYSSSDHLPVASEEARAAIHALFPDYVSAL